MDPEGGTPKPAPTSSLPDLVEGIFPPGQVHLIGGSREAGKTSLETWMQKHILSGEDFLGRRTWCPRWWGLLILDRSDEDRKYWWKQAGIGPLPHYCMTNDPDMAPEKLLRADASPDPAEKIILLKKLIDRLNPPRGGVLTIDVVNFFVTDQRVSYTKGYANGWAISKIAAEKEITILALIHGGKQRSQDRYVRATDRIIASTGFLGAVGTVCYITTPEESTTMGDDEHIYHDFHWEPHHGAAQKFVLERDKENGLYKFVSMTEARNQNKSTKQAEKEAEEPLAAERWNLYLPWFPPEGSDAFITTSEIVKRAGLIPGWDIPKRTVERDLAGMEEAGLIRRLAQGKWQRREGD